MRRPTLTTPQVVPRAKAQSRVRPTSAGPGSSSGLSPPLRTTFLAPGQSQCRPFLSTSDGTLAVVLSTGQPYTGAGASPMPDSQAAQLIRHHTRRIKTLRQRLHPQPPPPQPQPAIPRLSHFHHLRVAARP
jgi:hypothetical protein